MKRRTTKALRSLLLSATIVSFVLSDYVLASSTQRNHNIQGWAGRVVGSRLPWTLKRGRRAKKHTLAMKSNPGDALHSDIFQNPVQKQQQLSEKVIVAGEDEDEDEERESSSSAVSSAASVLAVLQSFLQNPTVRGWAANGLQLGLIAFLVRMVWQSAAEVLEEFSKELSGADVPLASPEQVTLAMSLIEHHAGLKDPSSISTDESNFLPPGLLSLTRQLILSGVPFRSDGGVSVESVLLSLTRNEAALLSQCLWTPSLNPYNETTLREAWHGVAGLHSVKVRLLDSVANIRGRYSQAYAALFDDAASAGGILLYGPPGCGKTSLIKALAGTTRLPCLILTPSILLRKYVGDSNLKVRSLFSLASKLAPCVLCIDELDGLFRERNMNEHEVSREIKTEFLQWWDGMLSGSGRQGGGGGRVLVVGATNRPFDVDTAVLRRLPQAYFVGLPDREARLVLLTRLANAVPTEEGFDLESIASRTEGYSPSDLRQVMQTAALGGPLREAQLQQQQRPDSSSSSSSSSHLSRPRPLVTSDVFRALDMVRPTPLNQQYRTALSNFVMSHSPHHHHPHSLSTTGAPTASQQNPGTGTWETRYGNFFDAGTIELDHETFDLLTDIAKEMETLSDDRDNDDSDFD